VQGRRERSGDSTLRHGWISGVINGAKGPSSGAKGTILPHSVFLFQIFVRAFDLDERLVGVAFLDVGIYVTSLRAVKNLLVIGDAVKSVWFVAFQVSSQPTLLINLLIIQNRLIKEDPYKLVVVAKDVRRHAISKADLFFNDETVSIVAGDEEGVMRIFAFDPQGLLFVTTSHTGLTMVLRPRV
jgi:hypothetical protein